MIKQENKGKEPKVIVLDESTKAVYVEGIGKAIGVGTLDMKGFINKAMNMPSFWR